MKIDCHKLSDKLSTYSSIRSPSLGLGPSVSLWASLGSTSGF
jgi:hypothetical protein